MSSRIPLSTTEEMMLSPRRLKSMLYFCGLVFLVSSNFCWQTVSSFSTRLPSSCGSTAHNNDNRSNHQQIQIQQETINCYQRSSSILILAAESSSSSSVSSPETTTTTTATAEEIQVLFSKYCDEDRLISKKTIESMPPFDDMLGDGDLLPIEFNDVWEAVPKSADDSSRVDDVSFIQIYRDVDDLFEEDDDEEDEDDDSSVESSSKDDNKDDVLSENNKLDIELLKIYMSISNEDGLISKDVLMEWDEVQGLIEDGLLGEDEFDELFDKTSKNGMLDDNGFYHFNVALEDLFVFDDDDDDDDDDDNDEASTTTENAPRSMITEDDLPPGVLFSQLCDGDYLVGMDELNLWTELKDMLKEGDLLPTELLAMYNKLVTPDSSGKLNEAGFLKLYDEIDSLFEEDDDDDDDDDDNNKEENAVQQVAASEKSQMENMRVKEDLLSFLDIIQDSDDAEPCGLSAEESDQEQVLNIVSILEKQSTNIIKQKDIVLSDLAGNWELLYTSSAGMKFNKGLSGIGGSFPNGRFGGLNQKLTFTKYVSDLEYKERIEVTPSSASFDVTVTGSWDLRTSVSLFTGLPTIIMYLEPDRVKYVLGSTRADHWKSLGPTNRMDLSYLDDDIRVMRGCTSTDTLLIYRKIS